MIDPNIWRRMFPVVMEQKVAAEQHVLSGGCDHQDYVRMCERIRCINEILGLAQEAEEEWMRIANREQEPS